MFLVSKEKLTRWYQPLLCSLLLLLPLGACSFDSSDLTDKDLCADDRDCVNGLACRQGRCGLLTADGGFDGDTGQLPVEDECPCQPGQYCDSGRCLPGCGEHADCPAHQNCLDHQCHDHKCTENHHCPQDKWCTAEGICIDEQLECSSIHDCDEGMSCLQPGFCLPEGVECTSSTHCQASFTCNSLGFCVPEGTECAQDHHCGEGLICVEPGQCTETANLCGATHCPDDHTCNPWEHCVPNSKECTDAAHCPEGWACEHEICLPPGHECRHYVGCPVGHVCNMVGQCVPDGPEPDLCEQCETHSDCGNAKSICVTGDITDFNGNPISVDNGCSNSCHSNHDCPKGADCMQVAAAQGEVFKICWPKRPSCMGWRSLRNHCERHSDCGPGAEDFCRGWPYYYCSWNCTENQDCPDNYLCWFGRCARNP